ncbi:hypothetical protein N7492_005355 [Penicillium capsulatum]|uniref:Uncharacterized protein n=1 Tax=Penicillium capsulatum TaxID=69766 RepID=A0A9W9ID93_9EURO|nr:hypothetical protein N7492_005355 [Penicillium capsulatum]KAJ6135545.1 hypothetical protein N7512_000705 [Penicillium capsulatum]
MFHYHVIQCVLPIGAGFTSYSYGPITSPLRWRWGNRDLEVTDFVSACSRKQYVRPTSTVEHSMLEILEVGCHMEMPENEFCVDTSVNILKSLVREIYWGQNICSSTKAPNLPVFIPRCLYKAAMVCLHDSRVSGEDQEPLVTSYKILLGHLRERWAAAGNCLSPADNIMCSLKLGNYLTKIEIAQNKSIS